MFKAEISNSSLEEILECSVPMYKFVIADKLKIRTVGIKLFRLLIVCRKHPRECATIMSSGFLDT